MQCAEIVDAGKPLRLVDRPIPAVASDGALIKITCAGICHSDLHFLEDEVDLGDGKFFRYRDILGDRFRGVVLGHEVAGVILDLGKNAKDRGLEIGDRVLVYPWSGCLECEMCVAGYGNLCPNNVGGSVDLGQGGWIGGFSTHTMVPKIRNCLKIPDNIPDHIACMLPCSALTAYSALLIVNDTVRFAASLKRAARVLIIGCGGLGFWCLRLAKYVFWDSPCQIIMADTVTSKVEQARRLGADMTILWNSKDETGMLAATEEVVGKQGSVDAVIDFVGVPSTLRVARHFVRKGGCICPLGMFGGQVTLPIPEIIGQSLSIRGNRTGSVVNLAKLVDLVAKFSIEGPPTEFVKLANINESFERLEAAQFKGRAILKFN